MQEQNENNYGVYQSGSGCAVNQSETKGRASELSFGLGIASLGMILGNPFIGLVFGILSLVFYKSAVKRGQNKTVKEGLVMGLIGTIINGVFVGFWILYAVFIFFGIFTGLFLRL